MTNDVICTLLELVEKENEKNENNILITITLSHQDGLPIIEKTSLNYRKSLMEAHGTHLEECGEQLKGLLT